MKSIRDKIIKNIKRADPPGLKKKHLSHCLKPSFESFHLLFSSHVNRIKIVHCLSIVALSVLIIAILWVNRAQMYSVKKLQAENTYLQSCLTSASLRIDRLNRSLQEREKWENFLREKHNLPVIPDDIRSLGRGGNPQVDLVFDKTNPELSLEYNLVSEKLETIINRTDFTLKTHSDAVDLIKLKASIYNFTPSIYPTFGQISSPFGSRGNPFGRGREFHPGVDISNRKNTPIYATADGVVRSVGYNSGYGRTIDITHKFGYTTRYAHLNKYTVESGDKIKKGQLIAYMGSSGRTTGTHLHYEIRRWGKLLNPVKYFRLNQKEMLAELSKRSTIKY